MGERETAEGMRAGTFARGGEGEDLVVFWIELTVVALARMAGGGLVDGEFPTA